MNVLSLALVVEVFGGMIVKTSVLLLFALCVTHLMRRASAAARHFVWVAALTGVIVLPLLSPMLPGLRIPLPITVLAGSPSAITGLSPPVRTQILEARVRPAAIPGAPQTGLEPSAPVSGIGFSWFGWALLVWGAGGLLMGGRLLIGLAGVWSLARRGTKVTDGPWLHLAHDLASRLGIRRGVTLMQGAGGRIPMTWGILRPVIWLPLEAEEWTDDRRAVVLAHELAHVRRRDSLTQWIGHLALAAYWFNPLVWIAARRLHEERERACDDAVLRMGAAPVAYADHLLQVVRTIGDCPAPGAAMAMARRSHFEGRMRAILDRSTPRETVSPLRAVGIGALALGCFLPVAALRAELAPTSDAAVTNLSGDRDAPSPAPWRPQPLVGSQAAPAESVQSRSDPLTSYDRAGREMGQDFTRRAAAVATPRIDGERDRALVPVTETPPPLNAPQRSGEIGSSSSASGSASASRSASASGSASSTQELDSRGE